MDIKKEKQTGAEAPKVKGNKEQAKSRDTGNPDAVPGINTPGIEPPAFNPPVPNRAWTAMKRGDDLDQLSEEEKRMLYYGRDDIF
jgi:hypothetical protein